jgi:hypothetical protein
MQLYAMRLQPMHTVRTYLDRVAVRTVYHVAATVWTPVYLGSLLSRTF